MKALVILNTILEDEEWEGMECVASDFKRSYVEKAIAELEALQAPKTCDSCKFRNCLASEMEPCISCFVKVGYGNHYEPKDNA